MRRRGGDGDGPGRERDTERAWGFRRRRESEARDRKHLSTRCVAPLWGGQCPLSPVNGWPVSRPHGPPIPSVQRAWRRAGARQDPSLPLSEKKRTATAVAAAVVWWWRWAAWERGERSQLSCGQCACSVLHAPSGMGRRRAGERQGGRAAGRRCACASGKRPRRRRAERRAASARESRLRLPSSPWAPSLSSHLSDIACVWCFVLVWGGVEGEKARREMNF